MDPTVNQSRQATFSCTAQGNPVPTISWTGPSTNFTTEVTPEANFTVLSVLTIDSAVRVVHEGLYICSASNDVGHSPNSSAALTVQGTAGDPPPHNTRCTVDWPHQPPAPIALQVSSTSRPHYTLQSCCHVLFLSFHSYITFYPSLPSPFSFFCHVFLLLLTSPFPSPSVPPTLQAVQGRIGGVPERSVTLTFTISDASPEVQTENIQWTFRDLNGSSFNIPTNSLNTTFSNLMGVFSSDRLSLTLSGLTTDFEGTYTMTATNEAGSDSETIELAIESQCITIV